MKATKKKEITASEMGRRGGSENAKKGPEHFSSLGKKGMESRWGKKKITK